MIDAASGGALVDKTHKAARNLIANMAANSQQFGTRIDLPSKHVNEVNELGIFKFSSMITADSHDLAVLLNLNLLE
jgi:hypothetical protein